MAVKSPGTTDRPGEVEGVPVILKNGFSPANEPGSAD